MKPSTKNQNIPYVNLELTSSGFSKSKASTLVVFSSQLRNRQTDLANKKNISAKSKKVSSKNPTKNEAKNSSENTVQFNNLPAGLNVLLQSSVSNKVITGKSNETLFFREMSFENFSNVLVVGLGETESLTHEILRASGGAIESCLQANSVTSAYIDFDTLPSIDSSKMEQTFSFAKSLQGFAEGLLLSSYRFNELKSKNDTSKKINIAINSLSTSSEIKNAFKEAQINGECVNFSRRLGDMPGNLMTPTILAKEVQAAAKGTALKVTVWDKKRIEKEKMGGLLGVAQGSIEEPRFIIMEYKGAGNSEKPVVYVGKGLTFDSGGISIKPSAQMEEMKYDMCGGANVIGTLLAIAKLKLKVNVIGLVPSTENMPSGSATKPGDIHTARNGKTFEVNNTDAEGRLILADALCYASELKPAAIFDAATLTGAMVIALGNIHTGYFTRDKNVKDKIEQAAVHSGELVWNMPLCDHHVKDISGTFADFSNISSGKGAGSATAAAFLEQFVEKGIPWAHFDIAGTGWAAGNRLNYCSKKGASGAIIRTFVELARSFEK